MAETRHEIVDLEAFKESTALTVPESLEGFLAQRLLQYQAEVEALINRPCWVVVTGEIVTDMIGGGVLVTRRRPVVSIEETTPEEDCIITSGGLIGFTSTSTASRYLYPSTNITISYTSRLPEERENAIISTIYARAERALVRAIDEAQSTNSVNEVGYTASYETEGWTTDEKMALQLMRKRSSR